MMAAASTSGTRHLRNCDSCVRLFLREWRGEMRQSQEPIGDRREQRRQAAHVVVRHQGKISKKSLGTALFMKKLAVSSM